MAEIQGYVEAINDYGLKLQNLEGPKKGWWNYSQPQYRKVPWDDHQRGDFVYLTVSDAGYISTIKRHGAEQAPAPSAPQPQAAPPPPPPDAPIPWEGPPPSAPPDQWPTEKVPGKAFIDKDISIGRQTCVKAAAELEVALIMAGHATVQTGDTVRQKTPEEIGAETAAIANALRLVIEQ